MQLGFAPQAQPVNITITNLTTFSFIRVRGVEGSLLTSGLNGFHHSGHKKNSDFWL